MSHFHPILYMLLLIEQNFEKNAPFSTLTQLPKLRLAGQLLQCTCGCGSFIQSIFLSEFLPAEIREESQAGTRRLAWAPSDFPHLFASMQGCHAPDLPILLFMGVGGFWDSQSATKDIPNNPIQKIVPCPRSQTSIQYPTTKHQIYNYKLQGCIYQDKTLYSRIACCFILLVCKCLSLTT